MSGVGKGVATASIGKILQGKGFKVVAIKIDPYVNIDAGTMNPIEHGDVFVTKDGIECDQDIGNYERFLNQELITDNYITTGRVYQAVINRERNLGYGGKCVEVVPHIPEEVIFRIKKAAKNAKADFVLVEIGGTVGEYQNMLFLEAARMIKLAAPKDALFILISYLPVPEIIGEMKTKPVQQAVKWLNMAGIQPDIILARSIVSLDELRKKKVSVFCNVEKKDVISAPDVASIYEAPLNFEREKLGNKVLKKFGLAPRKTKNLKEWEDLLKIIKTTGKIVRIGVVGKYFESGKFVLMDSYISIIEAIKHACWAFGLNPQISWLSSQEYENNSAKIKELRKCDGIIIPGGFGGRGIEGKIKVIEFCRKNKIPFLGICLGMQLAVIEFARNVCGLKNANSREFLPDCSEPVIDVMAEQKKFLKEKRYGGTMRLGNYQCEIIPKTASFRAYSPFLKNVQKKKKTLFIEERHRHRYELNNTFRKKLEKEGMVMAGVNPKNNLVEIVELKNSHPFFVAAQFHPEFKSRPLNPHPLFREFIRTCAKKK